MANDVDQWAQAGTALLQQTQAERIRASVGVALPGNPDQEAELRRASAAARVPLETARAMPDVVKRQAQLSQFDATRLAQQFPATGAWISVPDNARLAVDDVHPITQVEAAVRALGQPGLPKADDRTVLDRVSSSDFWTGAAKYLFSANDDGNNLGSDIVGAARSVSGKIGQAGALALAGGLTLTDAVGLTSGAAKETALGWAKMYADQTDAENEKPKAFHNELVRTAASLGLQLPMILATGGQSAAPQASTSIAQFLGQATIQGTKGMSVPAVTDAVQTMRTVYAQTGDLDAAAKAGQAQFALSSAAGVVPLSAPGSTLQRLLGGAVVGGVQGEATRPVMNAAMPEGMETPFRWEDVLLNSLTGSLMAGAMGPRAEPQRAAAVRAFNDAYEAARAEQASEQVTGLAQAANTSKLRERDPLAFKQLVADMADRGDLPQVLHVDAGRFEEVLAENGITGDELAQTMPRVAEQLDALRQAGGPRNVPVEIPVEDFATHIAGSDLEKPLLAEMRVTPEGKTVAEAQAFRQEQQADMQARAEKLTEQHTQDKAYQESLDLMNQQVDAQLAGLQMRPDQLDANTALLRAFYQVQAERTGVMPHEFAERYPLRGTNKALGGDALEQAESPELIIQHNLTASNLMHAKKMGGIAVPSLAVTKGTKPLTGFGEITLLGDKTLADPKGYAKTKVFGADIYSPRYPGVEHQIDNKKLGALVKQLRGWADKLGEGYLSESELARRGPEEMRTSLAVMAKFLEEQGVEPSVVMRSGLSPEREARLREFGLGEYLGRTDAYDLRTDEGFERAAIAEHLAAVMDGANEVKRARYEKWAQDPEVTDGWVRSAANEIAADGKLRKSPTADRYQTLRGMEAQIESAGLQKAFEEHTAKLTAEVTKAERIFKGFSNSGDRKYVPHTLDNVVRILKDQLRGGESFNYGVGSLRAHYTPEFKSLDAIRKSKNKLVSETEFEAVKTEINADFDKLQETVGVSGDRLTDVLADAAKLGLDRAAKDFGLTWTGEQKQALADFLNKLRDLPTAYFEAKVLRAVSPSEFKGAVVPHDTNAEALQFLKDSGVEDIRTYQRGDEADRAAKIAEFDHLFFQRQQSPEARGTYSPSTKTIALLKGANLSTFQHELGHFFLDTLTHLAATIEGTQRDGAGLSPGELEVLDDARRLLEWGGVENLTDWHARTVDQQRELHEKFATGWETYLMEGKAPTVELRSLFARFRSWMISVYKTLKGAPGEFTPEVRGVMDRMIASADAIREAELARRYMPLFDDPAKAGMNPEEWAAYQAQGRDATELAIEQLTGKTLRDMARIDRLRAASLAAVEKDAKAKMKAIEREVKAEVMSQPVYRAWAFLTAKGESDRQATEDKAKGSKALDPGKDSLLVAIAKLGGLDREAARRDLGVHQDYHKTESGVFGKPVFRKTGGLSAERMAEALAEHYYLPPDYSLHHLEDAISEELGGTPQYSWQKEQGEATPVPLDPEQITHGKLRTSDLREMFGEKEDAAWRRLSDLGMTSDKAGVSPDLVAELFGFDSGHEMALALAKADHPREVIRGMSEQRMLERHGEIATPQDMAREADAAVANEVRAQFVARELKAVKQAAGSAREIAKAAKEVAEQMVDAQRVRDIREGKYSAAATRAAREAEKLMAKGDTQGAAMSKRDQLLNLELHRASRDAREWVKQAGEYLRKFDTDTIRKSVDPEYVDQIEALLERFDLRAATTGKEIDRRKSLADWLKAQEALGLEPDLPPQVLNEALRTSYKELTLSELKGLVDSVKQIEHLGRLKSKMLTAADQRAYEAVRDEMAASIVDNAGGRTADIRTPTTNLGLALKGLREFGAAHIKAATWARILDGGKDGGPVWEYLIRPANAAGDKEVALRAAATKALHDIMAPLLAGERMGGKGRYFPTIDRALNRQERIAIALNTGNEGNLQRLLGGEGWTREQIQPVLDAITPEEARAVQAIWDHFETYRPEVGAMEKRIYGKEPEWVQPTPIKLGGEDLRGGYYPVKYDPAASVRAEEHADAEGAKRQLQGAYGAATVRRSFAKTRAEEVKGRPLLYSLSGIYQGVNETIHALAWSEWLIDANRLLKSTSIDRAIRERYGPEAVRQFKTWRDAVAEGEQAVNGALDKALGAVRQSVSVAGLGFNVMSAAMQPLGFTQSMVRLGPTWAARGLKHYLASPIESAAQAREMSPFMASRARTRFRELNELRNRVQEQSAIRTAMQENAYLLMMKTQQMVDVPTWWGGYEKAIAEGNDEARAIALADQAVIDSQGGGQTKDLSAIEMGGQAQRLFTVFYSFMNTSLNLGVTSTMGPASKAKTAADYLLLYSVPAVLGALLKDTLTPGDSGDYDTPEEAAKKLAGEQIGFLGGLMVVVREFTEAGKTALGLSDGARSYSGPAGVRLISDTGTFAKQAHQGEFDDSFRKAAVNLLGDVAGIPSAQINRTVTGAKALKEGKTQNPLAVVFGYQEPR